MKRLLPMTAAALVVLAGVPATTAHAADTPTCQGRPVTIVSTQTSATVTGTAGPDVVLVTGYGSTVDTGDGDDTVCATGGFARVTTGAGDDVVVAGNDIDDPEQGDIVDLGTGSDTFTGGGETDRVETGPGPGHDVVSTGDNKDFVTLSTSDVDVSTGNGRDHVDLDGTTPGSGAIRMGRAKDVVGVVDVAGHATVDLRKHRIDLDGSTYSLLAAEVVNASAERADVVGDRHVNIVYVTACDATITGGAGDDRIRAYGPRDTLGALTCSSVRGHVFGGPGNDTMVANEGRHVLDGGPGVDTAIFPKGSARKGHTVCHAERDRC